MKQNIIFFGASSTIASELIKYYSDDKSNRIYAFSQTKLNYRGVHCYQLGYEKASLKKIKDLLKEIEINIVFLID